MTTFIKEHKWVNNHGQPPSKRRRINAAYVSVSFLNHLRALSSLVRGAVDSLIMGRVALDRRALDKNGFLTLCQVLDMPQEEDTMCGRKADLLNVRQKRAQLPWI